MEEEDSRQSQEVAPEWGNARNVGENVPELTSGPFKYSSHLMEKELGLERA